VYYDIIFYKTMQKYSHQNFFFLSPCRKFSSNITVKSRVFQVYRMMFKVKILVSLMKWRLKKVIVNDYNKLSDVCYSFDTFVFDSKLKFQPHKVSPK